MPEENKNQDRDISSIRRELLALLNKKRELEQIKAQESMSNETIKKQTGGKQKRLSLYDRFSVFIVGLGIATSGLFAIWLNSLI